MDNITVIEAAGPGERAPSRLITGSVQKLRSWPQCPEGPMGWLSVRLPGWPLVTLKPVIVQVQSGSDGSHSGESSSAR